jgi:hypothetical protein
MAITINGSDGISDLRSTTDGSASTPAIRGTDTNTGIFFPAADTIAFAEGGAEVDRFNSSGDLGIGVIPTTLTASASSLQVYGGASQGRIAVQNATTGSTSTSGFHLCAIGDRAVLDQRSNSSLEFTTNATERMRIDSSGNLLVGTTSTQACTIWTGAGSVIKNSSATTNTKLLEVAGSDASVPTFAVFYNSNNVNMNSANATVKIGQMSGTGRSINSTGSINANGADYAEYMVKAGNFTISKGDVCGIDANGKLTNVFADSIGFVVKSTNPSYVGNDIWGADLEGDALEAARQTVDRIAFTGQVPVNVIGATAGQYIVPVNDNGAIKGEAISNPTFEQYKIAVGKVIAIEEDGRARIIVKVA